MSKTAALLIATFLLSIASGAALAQFDQAPAAPLALAQTVSGSAYDIQVHSRDAVTWADNALEAMQNEHGANCSGPPSTHENRSYAGAVFVCNNHVMTAINASGYGEIVLTPSQLADWSANSATIQWEMSTQRQSLRDWPDLWISPWNQNLTLPFDAGDVDNQGVPLNAIHVDLNNAQSAWVLKTVTNGVTSPLNNSVSTSPMGAGIASSVNQAAVRQTFRLTVSSTRLRLERVASSTAPGAVYFDGSIPALNFTQGVVQFAHHSYNPTKDGSGTPATWHWDEMAISPAVAFTIIKTHTRALFQNGSVVFNAPAPANSWLRFSAVGAIQYSLDGGKTYQSATKQAFKGHPEHASPYFISVPTGTRNVLFKFSADSWYQGPFNAKDFAIWSKTATQPAGSGPITTATPAPSATRTPTAIPGAKTPTLVTPIATPTTSQAWTSSATASRATLPAGSSQTVTASVKASQATTALVFIEIYDPAGKQVYQTSQDRLAFTAGTSRSFPVTWQVPSNAVRGNYTVKVGVFSPGWGQLWSWNDAAVRFTVN